MFNPNSIILATDSYKLTHWNQYPEGTEIVYSYFESRPGAEYDETVFFGLQYIIEQYLVGQVVTQSSVDEAAKLAKVHLGDESLFNREGWEYIVKEHNGKLPIRIKAVPEGSVIPTGNVLMTVENTDPKCFWLTNALESLLTHVWYSSTVASKSRAVKKMLKEHLATSAESDAMLDFMLQDFGYRGAASHESAAIGGAGHLVNFKGTDTLPAMLLAINYYDANIEDLGFSVPATEHSVMTSRGEDGEFAVVQQLLINYPNGILSVVADSYDIHRFVETLGRPQYKTQILHRDGVLVVRPDSGDPVTTTLAVIRGLERSFGAVTNSKGYKVLNPKVRVLWGDGIDIDGINEICVALINAGYSVENMACFGMGGGLLQKVNRDTQRFAFKSSAQRRNGVWHDVFKNPLDASKASKRGRLVLARTFGYTTLPLNHRGGQALIVDQLQTVFEDGVAKKQYTFDQVRENAKL